MNTHTSTLYPMMAVGAFMTMFWTGIVVGHELGLGCFSLLAAGLLSGCIATVLVAELERRDRYGSQGRLHPASSQGRPVAVGVGSEIALQREPASGRGAVAPIGIATPASGVSGA